MTKNTPTIYDFGFRDEGPKPAKLKALTEAYDNGVSNAALYLGFHHFPPQGEDPEQAFYWFRKASAQHNTSAIAANRWLAKCYMDGIGTQVDYWRAYIHNEVYFHLYNRYWPAPEEERQNPENYKVIIHRYTEETASANLSDSEKNSALDAAMKVCEKFPAKIKSERIEIPNSLLKKNRQGFRLRLTSWLFSRKN
jgi:TPR repeat protein